MSEVIKEETEWDGTEFRYGIILSDHTCWTSSSGQALFLSIFCGREGTFSKTYYVLL